MKEFILVKQRVVFGGNEVITSENRVKKIPIECDYFKKNRDEVILTEKNINTAREFFNLNYKVGDIHYSPLKSISFIKGGVVIETHNVLADPYYKLYEVIDGEEILIDKHKCGG